MASEITHDRSGRSPLVVVTALVALAVLGVGAWAGVTALSGDADDDGVVPFERRPVSTENIPAPTAAQAALKVRLLDVPRRAFFDSDLRYVVELRNTGDEDVSLDPCPAFFQVWGESGTAVHQPGYLNCDEAPPAIYENDSVRFEMVISLPSGESLGTSRYSGTILWHLGGTGTDAEWASSDWVEITSPS